MTATIEELIATWRRRQLAAFQQASADAGSGPLHSRPAMLVSAAYARCANELAAWQRQAVTTNDQQKGGAT